MANENANDSFWQVNGTDTRMYIFCESSQFTIESIYHYEVYFSMLQCSMLHVSFAWEQKLYTSQFYFFTCMYFKVRWMKKCSTCYLLAVIQHCSTDFYARCKRYLLADPGGAPLPLRDPILSFSLAFPPKSSHVGGYHPLPQVSMQLSNVLQTGALRFFFHL